MNDGEKSNVIPMGGAAIAEPPEKPPEENDERPPWADAICHRTIGPAATPQACLGPVCVLGVLLPGKDDTTMFVCADLVERMQQREIGRGLNVLANNVGVIAALVKEGSRTIVTPFGGN